MPRVSKRIKSKAKQITEKDFLFWDFQYGTAIFEDGFDKFLIGRTFSEKITPEALWETYGKEFLAQWIKGNPCTRPIFWWALDAPRWKDPFEGWFIHGTIEEPRQRLGGIGTPRYEVLNFVPSFCKGIPTGWVEKWMEDYYNGRARDIHGNIIPTKYKEGNFTGKAIDPDDPPTFESEAVYLERHGLLTPGEVRYLGEHPELRKPVVVEAESL